jgi:PAS domain-containing protein
LYVRQLLDLLNVGILIANDDAMYVDANRAACQLLGIPLPDLVGHHLGDFIEPGAADHVALQWKAFIRDGSQSGVFRMKMPEGSLRQFNFHAHANFIPGLHCSFITPAPESQHASGDQNILTICAWTKRVRVGDEWVSIEDYLMQTARVSISHGMSPHAYSVFERR